MLRTEDFGYSLERTRTGRSSPRLETWWSRRRTGTFFRIRFWVADGLPITISAMLAGIGYRSAWGRR